MACDSLHQHHVAVAHCVTHASGRHMPRLALHTALHRCCLLSGSAYLCPGRAPSGMLPSAVAPGRALHRGNFQAHVPPASSEAAAADGSTGSPGGSMTRRHVMRAARSSGTARGRDRSKYREGGGGAEARPATSSAPHNVAFLSSGGAHSSHSGDWVGGLGEEVPGQRSSTILTSHSCQMRTHL